MPKRTNEFQELIATVYAQIVPEGGKVTGSGMVHDRDAGVLREVDILIEYRYAHHDQKIAIECRDRSRKDSVEWIDSLIGKIKSLSVNKLVAVSKEGFTDSARTKAAAHNIDVLTVEQAIDTDWENYPIRPGVVVISGENYRLHDVRYRRGDEFYPMTELGLDSLVELNGAEAGTLKEACEYLFKQYVVPYIEENKKKEIMSLFKTVEDLGKEGCIETGHTLPGLAVRGENSELIDISGLQFVVFGKRNTHPVEQEHFKLNDLMISTGKFVDQDDSSITFQIVQDPETEKIHASWRRKKDEDA